MKISTEWVTSKVIYRGITFIKKTMNVINRYCINKGRKINDNLFPKHKKFV